LVDALLLKEVLEHALEALEAVLANLSTDCFSHSSEFLGCQNTSAAALSAWKPFLVDL